MRHAGFVIRLVGIAAVMFLSACSTDTRGLGPFDAHGSGGRTAAGTGGLRGGASGFQTGGSSAGATGGAATGGKDDGSGGSVSATGGVGSPGSGGDPGDAGGGSPVTGGRGGISAGAGGRSATGTGGNRGMAGAPGPDCATADDCRLYTDCCTCEAVGVNARNPPLCGLLCIQSKCNQLQANEDTLACVAGRCVVGFNCDASTVTCRTAPPACPIGEVAEINGSGACYTQRCVPATQCLSVTNCGACGPAPDACVRLQTQTGNRFHCVTVPATCTGAATCACLGASSCVTPYRTCNELSSQRGVSCSCPNC